jgi:hypothetical protein
MLELILIAAVMVFIVSRLDSRHFEEAKSHWGLGRAPASAQGGAEAPRPRPRLAIEGTQRPGIANPGFVKGYGLNPQRLADLRVYARFGRYDQFPESIRRLLAELHDAGCAVGTTIMELMFHGRGLGEGEAVYFALVEDTREPHVVAFVDRLRLR